MRTGELIRRHRLAAGLTQKQFGARLDVTGPAVSEWESGRTVPDRVRIRDIAHALGLDEPSRAALERAAQLDDYDKAAAGSAA